MIRTEKTPVSKETPNVQTRNADPAKQRQCRDRLSTGPDMTKQTFDVIIVGGGSAGAVLAARLSGDAKRRVLLLDAGSDFAPDRYPPALTNANVVAGSPAFD